MNADDVIRILLSYSILINVCAKMAGLINKNTKYTDLMGVEWFQYSSDEYCVTVCNMVEFHVNSNQ